MDERKIFSVLLITFASVFVYSVFFAGTPDEQISGDIVASGQNVPSLQPNHALGPRPPRPSVQQTPSSSSFLNQTNQTNTTVRLPAVYPSTIKRVFVTSTLYPANLGGFNGGVQMCTQRAAAANLGGQWVPWLSILSNITTVHAKTMIPNAKYVLLNGQTLAISKTDLTDGTISRPLDRTEYNQNVAAPLRVWTGTRFNGQASGRDCGSWAVTLNQSVGTVGSPNVANQAWTDQISFSCGGMARLYCFER